jgi:hypothetical protein
VTQLAQEKKIYIEVRVFMQPQHSLPSARVELNSFDIATGYLLDDRVSISGKGKRLFSFAQNV